MGHLQLQEHPGGRCPVRHVPLILPNVHVVELGGIARLDLDLLGHISIGVAIEAAEDGSELAFFCLVAALKGFKHLSVGRWIF